MNWKKFAALSLSVVLGVGALAACTNGTDKGDDKPTGDALKSCTVRLALPTNSDPADWEFVQETINFELKQDGKPYQIRMEFLDETDYPKNILLYANDGYDLGWFHAEALSGALQAKALKDATPYLAAHGAELLAHTPDYAWKSARQDGKTYLIPRSMPVSDNKYTVAARKDWMREYGMTQIETISELDTYSRKTYEKFQKLEDPTGYYVYSADNHYDFLYREYAPSFYFPFVNWAEKPLYIDLDDETGSYRVKNFYETKEFQSICNKANEYYRLGYVSKESIAGSENNFNAGLLGLVWSTLFKTSERIDDFKASASAIAPDADLYDVYLNPDENRYIVEGFENAMGLLSGGKNPNEAVDFLNWARSTQEHHDLVCYGVQGRNYNLTDDGKLDFSEIDADMRFSAKMPYWCFNDVRFARWTRNLDDAAVNRLKTWDEGDNVIVSDLVGFMPDMRSTALSSAYNNVKASGSVVTNLIDGRYALGEVVDGKTRYKKLLDDVKAAGIDTLIDELQKQVDAFLAAK